MRTFLLLLSLATMSGQLRGWQDQEKSGKMEPKPCCLPEACLTSEFILRYQSPDLMQAAGNEYPFLKVSGQEQ